MRQRITFFHPPQSPVDPASIRVAHDVLTGPSIQAAREDRVTLALDELPVGLGRLLADAVHELHVRWVAPDAFEAVSPLFARLSPGLHVFYTPRTGNTGTAKSKEICILLQQLFGPTLDCKSHIESFTASGGDRFSHSAAFHYYSPLDNLSAFTEYVETEWCPPSNSVGACPLRPAQLGKAGALGLSYDAISHTLQTTSFWPLGQQDLSVTALSGSRTEVGIMGADSPPSLGPYDLGMAGHVVVLGADAHLSPVLFSFPSRHRQDNAASFTSSFTKPTGLHPTLQLEITSGQPPRTDEDGVSSSSCKLHAYFTLPRHIFADKYQLSDPLFLASKNLTALHHITQPVDLEAPDYAVDIWGSAALLELAPPPLPATSNAGDPGDRDGTNEQVWTAQVPLHLRYLQPADGGYRAVEVPYPAVFWACAAEEGTKFSTNPFDQVHLGYDGLFGPRTEFWHVAPRPEKGISAASTATSPRLTTPIRVPVLDAEKSQWVNAGTALAILLGFGWVFWSLLSVYRKAGYGRVSTKDNAATEEKKTQ